MPMSQDQAIQIARAFVQQRHDLETDPLHYDSPTVRHKRGGYGTDHLGMGATYWSVMFERVEQEDVVMSPGEVIVLVDEESGRVEPFVTP